MDSTALQEMQSVLRLQLTFEDKWTETGEASALRQCYSIITGLLLGANRAIDDLLYISSEIEPILTRERSFCLENLLTYDDMLAGTYCTSSYTLLYVIWCGSLQTVPGFEVCE